MQRTIRAACAESPWYWINLLAWTSRQKKALPDGSEVAVSGDQANVPMVTWKVQDEFIADIVDAMDRGYDLDVNKSRDMAASWTTLAVFHWYWQFRSNVTFLELSRKEDYVYDRNNMDALMQKHLYILKWQPTWIRPAFRDTYMHLENLDNGSHILGESTNGDAGRGGRKIAILIDEAAAVPNAEEIDNATSQSTPCRIWVSTPKGPGTHFANRILQRRGKLIELPWWRHPEKSVGAHQYIAEDGKVKWTSNWKKIKDGSMSRKAVAQEIEMDHGQAGDTFFDPDEIARHRKAHEKAPSLVANLRLVDDLGEDRKRDLIRRAVRSPLILDRAGERKPWRFYLPLVDGRPLQSLTYVFGIDIANGTGGSNSVITVVAHETGQVVAKFWDAYTPPEELAEVAMFAGLWFGGMFGAAYLCWENNGPGGIFGRKVVGWKYPRYYTQRQENQKSTPKTPRWGWNSNEDAKAKLLGYYRESIKTDRIIQPCHESLDEALDYIYDDSGVLLPGKLRSETGGGRALHGDHVIADALADMARGELPKTRTQITRAPAMSFAGRRLAYQKAKRDRDEWRE